MNPILAVSSLSEKHSLYIELLLRDFYYQAAFFAYSHSHSCHRASRVFFQKCSLLLPHPLLYILIRIIEHRKPSRESCHSRGLDLSLIQNDRVYFITTWSFESLFIARSHRFKISNVIIHISISLFNKTLTFFSAKETIVFEISTA